jgi:replication factor C subunit 3/5
MEDGSWVYIWCAVCVLFLSLTPVLVLNEVDKLSKDAQHSLRRTMEKYSAACRLVLCCNSASKVIEAVRSRCLNIRINAPSRDEVSLHARWKHLGAVVMWVWNQFSDSVQWLCLSYQHSQLWLVIWQILDVLLFIAKKENLVLPPELAGRIVLQSNRNLRRAILCLEACRVQQCVSSSSLSPILKLGFVFSLQVSE